MQYDGVAGVIDNYQSLRSAPCGVSTKPVIALMLWTVDGFDHVEIETTAVRPRQTRYQIDQPDRHAPHSRLLLRHLSTREACTLELETCRSRRRPTVRLLCNVIKDEVEL